MVHSGTHLADNDEEKEAVYRFRYDVYVQEMGRYGEAADHENKRLVEPEDETARIWYAAQDGEVVATLRMSWGGDAPFTGRLIESYQLAPFLDELPPERSPWIAARQPFGLIAIANSDAMANAMTEGALKAANLAVEALAPF